MFGFDWTKLLNPKVWLYLAILAVLAYGGYKGYNWIFDRGAASRNGEIATLTKERDDAKANYARYKGEYDDWVTNTKKAQEQLLADQKADLDLRANRLAEAEEAARNKPTKIKEVIKYVPQEVDAAYRLPVGLIRLYRDTLEGTTTFGPGGAVPEGYSFDAGEASNLAMSQFGQIAASNNAECVLRGKVIEEWQGWYSVNKPAYDRLVQWMKDNGPKPDNGDAPPSNTIPPTPSMLQPVK